MILVYFKDINRDKINFPIFLLINEELEKLEKFYINIPKIINFNFKIINLIFYNINNNLHIIRIVSIYLKTYKIIIYNNIFALKINYSA